MNPSPPALPGEFLTSGPPGKFPEGKNFPGKKLNSWVIGEGFLKVTLRQSLVKSIICRSYAK